MLAKYEIALLDVRHETQFAHTHALFAANLALKHIERDAWRRIPRHDTFIEVYDLGEGLTQLALHQLQSMG